jgi:hypothetical protein
MSKLPARVRCTHVTRAGRPCKGWAVRGSDPPACISHLSSASAEPGFYSRSLTDEELVALVRHAADLTLDEEIACTRIAVRRTLEFLNRPGDLLSQGDFLRAAGLVFQGARTIARLLREQQALTGGADSRLEAIFDAALDGLSEDWGIEL